MAHSPSLSFFFSYFNSCITIFATSSVVFLQYIPFYPVAMLLLASVFSLCLVQMEVFVTEVKVSIDFLFGRNCVTSHSNTEQVFGGGSKKSFGFKTTSAYSKDYTLKKFFLIVTWNFLLTNFLPIAFWPVAGTTQLPQPFHLREVLHSLEVSSFNHWALHVLIAMWSY